MSDLIGSMFSQQKKRGMEKQATETTSHSSSPPSLDGRFRKLLIAGVVGSTIVFILSWSALVATVTTTMIGTPLLAVLMVPILVPPWIITFTVTAAFYFTVASIVLPLWLYGYLNGMNPPGAKLLDLFLAFIKEVVRKVKSLFKALGPLLKMLNMGGLASLASPLGLLKQIGSVSQPFGDLANIANPLHQFGNIATPRGSLGETITNINPLGHLGETLTQGANIANPLSNLGSTMSNLNPLGHLGEAVTNPIGHLGEAITSQTVGNLRFNITQEKDEFSETITESVSHISDAVTQPLEGVVDTLEKINPLGNIGNIKPPFGGIFDKSKGSPSKAS